MTGTARTRGQPAALAAATAAVREGGSHALLLVGPGGTGKTTLALDVAAMLLCTASPPDARPCRSCRACRMVESGNHPDVHRLTPEGPGGQVRIGERSSPEPNTIRGLVSALALLPVEGGARVAIVEQAHRMNEDAQSAFLKTLEEPGPGVTIVLCADEEERLLPTIRSRCARIRLGPVPVRDIEAILEERGAADAPTAARLGRIAGGRPGVALAYAAAPEAVAARAEIARLLLDLLEAPRSRRLGAVAGLLGAAADAARSLAAAGVPAAARSAGPASRRKGATVVTPEPGPPPEDADSTVAGAEPASKRAPVAERRRAAVLLVELWRDVARDLAVVQLGDLQRVRDPGLLDDLSAASANLEPGAAATFLDRLTRAGELLEANVSPELVVDGLVLAWPRKRTLTRAGVA
ncbi:MAG TPA: DNA polymerase III subunit [Candidatus Limnocylindrales bacterium]